MAMTAPGASSRLKTFVRKMGLAMFNSIVGQGDYPPRTSAKHSWHLINRGSPNRGTVEKFPYGQASKPIVGRGRRLRVLKTLNVVRSTPGQPISSLSGRRPNSNAVGRRLAVCRSHHRDLHRTGNELRWWGNLPSSQRPFVQIVDHYPPVPASKASPENVALGPASAAIGQPIDAQHPSIVTQICAVGAPIAKCPGWCRTKIYQRPLTVTPQDKVGRPTHAYMKPRWRISSGR